MKKALTFKITALALCVCMASGCLCGCAAGGESVSFFAMNTIMDMTAYGGGAKDALSDAEALIFRLDGLLSATDEKSQVYALNHGSAVEPAPETAELLAGALELCGLTGGALDISVRPVMEAWGFTTEQYRVPGEAELAALLENVDYEQVRRAYALSGGGSFALPEGMEIDLGAVAKGYASDMALELLRNAGVKSALLNLGGNVAALGSRPDGKPWRIGVKDPSGEREYVGVLEVADRCVITSGGYERYFEENGQVYWHILDPSTGLPARTGLASVTVVGESGLTCDGLSTALFVMGMDKALDFWRETGGFEAVFIEASGDITITAGLESIFTADGGGKVTVAGYEG